MLKIDSAQNATFKKLLGLTSAKGLKAEKLFLLSGEKLIREFLRAPKLGTEFEIIGLRMAPLAKKAKTVQLPAELFAQIDVLGTHFNILVLEQPEIAAIDDIDGYEPRGIEIVLPIGDPGNLGALIRSCEAFSVPRIILTKEAAHPFLPKSVKASAGSVLRMKLARGPALNKFPPDHCIALDSNGTDIGNFRWPAKGLLVVGEEGKGLGNAQFKRRVCIPTKGVESLNAMAAASIALYKLKESRQ